MMQSGPKVLISEHKLPSMIPQSQLTQANQSMRQVLTNDIYVAISKYSDSFMIVVNQTGTMGSIYKGRLVGEVLAEVAEEDLDCSEESVASNINPIETQKIFDIKCLFGSTQIQFYELLVRKILQTLFDGNKIDPAINVLVNVSLPVKSKLWPEYEHKYYQSIASQIGLSFKELI